MIKYYTLPALLLMPCLLFAQGDVANSNRTNVPVKVDGSASEWHLPLRYYDGNSRLFFDFCNNDTALYICFQTRDEQTARKILQAGMTLSMTTRGKDKDKVSIKFPLVQKGGKKTAPPQGEEGMKRENNPLIKNTVMEVRGFTTKDGIIPVNDLSGINAAMNHEINKTLTYELSIPLKELSGDDFIKDFAKQIELEAEVQALPQNAAGTGRGFPGERDGGHMRGSHGSDRNGEGDNTSEDDGTDPGALAGRSFLFQKTKFKQKFMLAPTR